MAAAVNRIVLHVADKIIHPAHVPLVVKAKAVVVQISGDLRPCGRLLGNHHHARILLLKYGIQMLQEFDRLQVLVSAVDVRHPLAVVLSVIQIEHGSHGVHADAVGMVLLRPEDRVGDQEVRHLRSAVVIDQSAPVRMRALARIEMLVQAGSVERGHSEGVAREVRRHPVQDHADPGLMQRVDKVHEVLRRSVAACGSVITGYLVAPGFVQRMFHNRHQLDMRVAHLFDIFHEHGSNLTVIVEISAVVGLSPGTEVHLIDIHRILLALQFFALLHPLLIAPLIISQIRHHRGIVRAQLAGVGVRIGFQVGQAALRLDLILINLSGLNSRDKELENSGSILTVHLMAASVPVVEISDHADAHGVRRPHGKVRSIRAVHSHRVRSQLLIDIVADACVKLLLFLLCDLARIGVGILPHALHSVPDRDKLVGYDSFHGDERREVALFLLNHRIRLIRVRCPHAHGIKTWKIALDQQSVFRHPGPQNIPRILLLRIHAGFNLRPVHIVVYFVSHKYLPTAWRCFLKIYFCARRDTSRHAFLRVIPARG